MNSNTIRLLVINDDKAEVERLLSMLGNAGKKTRAQHIPSKEGLEKILTDQAWDLLIGLNGSKTCDLKDAIRSIKKLDKDVPVIIQADVEDESERTIALIEGLKVGARDVVVLDDDQHLLLVMDRELQALEERRQRRSTDRKFNTMERRCQQLLDSSKDAIAYVEDGMFLYLNQTFGQLFGYEDPDDALAVPLVDMITEKDQKTYAQFIKDFKVSDSAGSQELAIQGLKSDGTEFALSFNVSHANYDDEACIQLSIEGVANTAMVTTAPTASAGANTQEGAAPATGNGNIDPTTGLHNRKYMLDAITSAVQDAAENDRYRSLYYIVVDRFDEHRKNLGMANTDAMLASLGKELKTHAEEGVTLAHLSDEEFMLLASGIDAEQHLQKATELCKKIESAICTAGSKSIQATITIGIAPISESATNPDDIINRAQKACNEAQTEEGSEAGNRAKVYVPKITSSDADIDAILEVIGHGLNSEAFNILFQPVISLQGEEEEHYEVLINLEDEEKKAIHTGKLFQAVENNAALAIKLDRWVILKSTKMLAEHRSKGHNTRLMLNLTSASLQDPGLPAWLKVAFKAGKIPPDAIIFQISENDATDYIAQAKTFSDVAKALGFHVCIKHFGCALDPFKTLSHLVNVDMVKIDNSFASDIQTKNENPKALKDLLTKITETKKKTIVPNVENATLMATLWQAGAHFIQGHYLQAPTKEMNFQFSDE